MKSHNWILEDEDYGCMGIEEGWVCKDCRADGGFSSYTKDNHPKAPVYGYATDSSGPLLLPEDCELSQKLIDAYELGRINGRYSMKNDQYRLNAQRPFAARLKYLLLGVLK